jgi:hypothetical protein
MRSWTVKCLFLGLALLLVTSVPAAAQGTFGAGLSFLGDDGGVGVTVDYSQPFKSLANNRTLGWVGDFSFHHNSIGGFDDFDVSISTITAQGGIRIGGPIGQNQKLTWHGQGLLGIMHANVSADDIIGDLCDDFDVDCDESDSQFIFTPGAGIDYAFNERTAFRAQIDFPIGSDASTTRVWFGISQKIGQ